MHKISKQIFKGDMTIIILTSYFNVFFSGFLLELQFLCGFYYLFLHFGTLFSIWVM